MALVIGCITGQLVPWDFRVSARLLVSLGNGVAADPLMPAQNVMAPEEAMFVWILESMTDQSIGQKSQQPIRRRVGDCRDLTLSQLFESAFWLSSTLDSDPGSAAAGAAGGAGAGSLDGAMEAGRFFLAGAAFFAGSLALSLPLVFVALLALAWEVVFFTAAAAAVGVLLAP